MDASHAQLADALARGRLAPAEIAAIPPRELEALFETGARCLDASRDTEALHILGGVVTLFPYSARYWRAYAIALHRRLEVERARAAYEASLALEPNHELTRCYRCEVLIYLGRADEAAVDLRALLDAKDPVTAERAAELLRQIDALSTWKPPPPEPEERSHPAADRPRFVLGERELPLEPSRFKDEAPLEPTQVREITRTARIFAPIAPIPAPISNEPTAELPEDLVEAAVAASNESSITATALLPGRKGRPPAESMPADGSATALLPGRKGRPPAPAPSPAPAAARSNPTENSTTALLPGRKGRPPAPDPTEQEGPSPGRNVMPVPWKRDASDTEVRGVRPEPVRPGGPVAAPVAPSSSETPTQTDVSILDDETGLLEDALDEALEVTHTAVTLRRDGALTFEREEE